MTIEESLDRAVAEKVKLAELANEREKELPPGKDRRLAGAVAERVHSDLMALVRVQKKIKRTPGTLSTWT